MSKRLEPTEGGTVQEPGRPERCPECDCEQLQTDDVRAELVCGTCGYVVETDLIDRGSEWVSFSQDEHEEISRLGVPLTEAIHDKGLTTRIHWQDVDAYGRKLPAKKRKQMHRLREWQTRIRTGQRGERNLQFALTEIHRMSSALGIPRPTREAAAVIYRRALDANLIRGRSIEAIAAGTLYIACREENIPRSLDEIASVARIERIEIARAYRHLAAEMGIMLEPVDPKRFVPRFCSELGLDTDVQQTAIESLEAASDEGLYSGKSPTALAAAAVYIGTILCEAECTQAEIADIAYVTAVTIRKRYREQLAAVSDGEIGDLENQQGEGTDPQHIEHLLQSE